MLVQKDVQFSREKCDKSGWPELVVRPQKKEVSDSSSSEDEEEEMEEEDDHEL